MTFEGVVADNEAVYFPLTSPATPTGYVEGDLRLRESFEHCGAFDPECAEPLLADYSAILGKDALNPYGLPSNDNGSATFVWNPAVFSPDFEAIQLERVDRSVFNLNSIEFALDPGFSSTGSIQLSAYDSLGAYDLNGDPLSPLASVILSAETDWQTYNFDSSWENASYVLMWTSGNVSIDNISTTVVPIPAAAWLFGSALAGLGWLRCTRPSLMPS